MSISRTTAAVGVRQPPACFQYPYQLEGMLSRVFRGESGKRVRRKNGKHQR
ncbi:MAG: hypothetical protein KatS3mg105_3730 [Gemmatales bacterium]|nr:MAG: hypothetical protein KatS3mg105_3730 [Gemmatales bacterium]